MIQNFRGKILNDIETDSDTIIHSSSFCSKSRNKISNNSILQNFEGPDTFETYLEKKNKDLK